MQTDVCGGMVCSLCVEDRLARKIVETAVDWQRIVELTVQDKKNSRAEERELVRLCEVGDAEAGVREPTAF